MSEQILNENTGQKTNQKQTLGTHTTITKHS